MTLCRALSGKRRAWTSKPSFTLLTVVEMMPELGGMPEVPLAKLHLALVPSTSTGTVPVGSSLVSTKRLTTTTALTEGLCTTQDGDGVYVQMFKPGRAIVR